MSQVTTVTLWVCSCGRVDRIDGGNSMATHEVCPIDSKGGRHNTKPVLVVVPIPWT